MTGIISYAHSEGFRPGPSSVGVAGPPNLPAVQANLQERRTPSAAEDGGDLLADDGPLLAFAAVELGGKIIDLPLGLSDLGLPGESRAAFWELRHQMIRCPSLVFATPSAVVQ